MIDAPGSCYRAKVRIKRFADWFVTVTLSGCGSRAMRFLSSLLAFVLTIFLSNALYTYFAMNFTITMRDLLLGVQSIRDQLGHLVSSEKFTVWVDIFLEPNLIVFVGVNILTWFFLAIVFSAFWRGPQRPSAAVASAAAMRLPFGRWG